ncbi:MAG: translesion error-prone DNA polymerase V autoproteolytic subunit [Bacteroidota bacterium]
MRVLPSDRSRPVEPLLRVISVVSASDVLPFDAIPVALCRVRAGFPSPAADYLEDQLDLHELLGVSAASCYFVRVEGESMTGERILDGDVVLVNRALEPVSGSIVVASLDGELTLKRLIQDERGTRLLPGHPSYPPIEVRDGQDLVIWGVVTFSIHDHRMRRAVTRVARAA